MVDYSKLSDQEINQEVTCVINPDAQKMALIGDGSCFYDCGHDGNGFYEIPVLNYCNNPADAWPIIVDSKISLHHSICKWDADSLVYDKKYKDGFFIFSSCSDIGDISSRGALRAAMIVFLMMQDTQNG